MMMRGLCCALSLALASVALGEESFYTIVGPDGRMQVIRGGQAAAPAKPKGSAAAVKPAEAAPAVDAGAGAQVAAPASTAAADEAETPVPAAGFAPYDSGEYADVEAVDDMLKSEAPRKRFYLIKDGMGSRVSETSEVAPGAVEEPVPAPEATRPAREAFRDIGSSLAEWTGEKASGDFPGLKECLGRDRLQAFRELQAGEAQGLIINREAYQFLDGSGVLEGYRLAGEGLRTVVLRSYSSKDVEPAFVEPPLAFLGEDGCLIRVIAGYSDRLYSATDARHPALRAEVVVHADDRYLLVMATGAQSPGPGRSFRSSRYGQVKLTLKK